MKTIFSLILGVLLVAGIALALAPPTIFETVDSEGKSLGDLDWRDLERWGELVYYLRLQTGNPDSLLVLDAGSGRGNFIPRIKKNLESLSFTNVEVHGLDNFMWVRNFMHKVADNVDDYEQGVKAMRKKTLDDLTGYTIYETDIASAHTLIKLRFDMVFINAPYPFLSITDKRWVKGALKLLKDNGILFMRFHKGETSLSRVNWMREVVQEMGYEITMRNTEGIFAEGDFPLDSQWTWIIKKKFWYDEQVTGHSLGFDFADSVFNMKAIERSA